METDDIDALAAARAAFTREDAEGLVYVYRPRLVGAASRFRLPADPAKAGTLDWTVGARSGVVRLRDVVRVGLSFQPGQIGAPNYVLALTTKGGETLRFGSLSRASLTAVEDHRGAFAAFVRALHGAIAESGAAPAYVAGLPRWRWGAMLVLAGATALALVALAVLAAGAGLALEAGVIIALGLVLGWPLAETLWRNVPGAYTSSAFPPRLFPG